MTLSGSSASRPQHPRTSWPHGNIGYTLEQSAGRASYTAAPFPCIDDLRYRWIDYGTYPTAAGMMHDVYEMDDATSCDFEGKTAAATVAVPGTEACEYTAGDESSCTTSGKC